MQQQVLAIADVDELAIVARQRLEPMIRGLDEDLRLVSGRAKHALDAEHLVADRVAVAQRREHLVDLHARLRPSGSSTGFGVAGPASARGFGAAGLKPTAGPRGSLASTSSAGGRS